MTPFTLMQLKEQMMLVEAQLEKQTDDLGNAEKLEQVRSAEILCHPTTLGVSPVTFVVFSSRSSCQRVTRSWIWPGRKPRCTRNNWLR